VDTKYEFGKTKDGVIVLIDEIHTDSSPILFRRDIRKDRIKEKSKSNCLKFVRRWLIQNGFKV
jgi:phosphoribosylaminoimidazole-succinocarboxamide synthase